jgi:hypothetical protein
MGKKCKFRAMPQAYCKFNTKTHSTRMEGGFIAVLGDTKGSVLYSAAMV